MSVIRRIRMDDVKKFVAFKNKSAEESDYINKTTEEKTIELFKMTLEWSGSDAWLLLEGGKIIGQLWVAYSDLEDKQKSSMRIQLISVLGEYRGKGNASKLIKFAEEEAKSRGCVKVTLVVANENTNAIELYKRLGYEDNTAVFKHKTRTMMEKKVGKHV